MTSQSTFQRLAVASLNQTPLDLVGNVARIREAIRLAAKDDATVLVLPCDSVIGFGAQRHRLRNDIASEVKLLKKQLAATAPLRVIFSEDGDTQLGDIILRTEQTPAPFLISKSLPSVLQVPSLVRALGNDVVAYAAPRGCAEGRFLYDGVSWIAVRGIRLVATTPFSFEDVTVITADIAAQITTPPPSSPNANTDKPDAVLFTEFSRAVSLGLYDYLRKSGTRQFVVSLSGGADSAVVAMLVYLAVVFGTDELGSQCFAKQLGLDVSDNATPCEITGRLLRCIYQATENSSDTTRNAAREVAAMVGARYDEVDVQPIVDLYIKTASAVIGRELDWSRDSASLQNIQARARSPLAWMLANVESGLLLCTSNRSEATVGYCTMDGDTSGGLAPLGGIDKAFLRKYLHWLQDDGIVVGETLHRFEKLASVNDQQPTAELLPPSARQTDEGDLMPYTLLNLLERWIVGESLSPREAALQLAEHELNPELNAAWVAKFMRLWQKNQWKRHRYALHFAIDADAPPDELLDAYPTLVRESHALTVAILGAGLMGRAIAAALTQAGFAVTLHDIGASIEELCAASVIIESIVEKTSAKKKVYRELANFRGILLTNTSTIPIATLSTAAPDPSRFCGLHFFHPVAERQLVEVISGPVTSPATIAFATSLAAALGKEVIHVADHAGFLVNRLLHPYLSTALTLAESVSTQDETIYHTIDAAAVEFGMAKGPFTLMDEIGLDVVWHGGFVLYKAFPNRVRISTTLETLVREGRLGVKTGQGFYTYPRREETTISTALDLSRQEIATRLITAMAAEAVRCYDDGTIDDLDLADIASIHGLGFPASLGGVVTWGRSQNVIARGFQQ